MKRCFYHITTWSSLLVVAWYVCAAQRPTILLEILGLCVLSGALGWYDHKVWKAHELEED